MELAKFKHSSGICILFLDYDPDYKELILCAVDYNKEGMNVQQVDLGAYKKKKFKKIIKKMKKFTKKQKG